MAIALWHDRFETGLDLIDAQHKGLFECLHQLDQALKAGSDKRTLEEGLAIVAQRTIKHFQTEERLMKEAGYPTRVRHSNQHTELVLQVRDLQYRQAKGHPLNREIAEYLANWFDHHIQDTDMDYVGYLKPGPSPVGGTQVTA